jgi:hemerythrin
MDDQHGVLMDTMNELRMAVMHGSGREQVCELLDRLIELTRMHFACEERLMEASGFPDLIEHRAEHHGMLAEMMEWAHRLQYNNRVEMRPLLCRLRDGFSEHIESVDARYGPWLNERGVS